MNYLGPFISGVHSGAAASQPGSITQRRVASSEEAGWEMLISVAGEQVEHHS